MRAEPVLWISEALHGLGAEWPGQAATWRTECRVPETALEGLRRCDYGAIVLDFPIASWSPAALLEEVQRLAPGTPVLIRDPQAQLSDAVRLTRLGVYQFLASGAEAGAQIEQAIEERRTRGLAHLAGSLGREEWERLLIGESREMRQVCHIIRMVGARRSTVLITGETGTGKEVAARALHMAGPRRHAALVPVNCSALPENLLEAELFGHVRGAFTGAVQNRIGRLELAQEAPCSWTKSATWSWTCRPSSSEFSRNASFKGWEAPRPCASTFAWWPRPIATCSGESSKAGSGRIFTTV